MGIISTAMSAIDIFTGGFANTGDRTSIPDEIQANGSVSREKGFTDHYELEYDNPNAKDIGRATFNEIEHTQDSAIAEIQQFGVSVFSDENGYIYPKGALAFYNNQVYQSLKNDNNSNPELKDWAVIISSFSLPVATLEQQGITQLTNVIDSSEDKAVTPKAVNTVKKKADQTPDALENKLLIGKDDKSYRLIDVDELTKLLSYAETTGTGLNIAMSQKAVTEALTDKSTALGPEQSTATVVLHQTFGDNMVAALTTVPKNSVVTSTYSEKWPAAAIRYRPIIRTGGSI